MEKIRNANNEIEEDRSSLEKICYKINNWIGSPAALIGIIIIQFIWIVVGEISHMDPYPFPFLLTVSNILQLILIFALSLGQKQTNKHTELRSEIDHETIVHILKLHSEQKEILNKINNKL